MRDLGIDRFACRRTRASPTRCWVVSMSSSASDRVIVRQWFRWPVPALRRCVNALDAFERRRASRPKSVNRWARSFVLDGRMSGSLVVELRCAARGLEWLAWSSRR
jgi:hypothetical protein